MKSNAVVRIVIFSILIFVLLAILVTGLLVKTFMANYRANTGNGTYLPTASDEYSTQGAVDASRISSIEIDWVAGSITIIPEENTDQITISETAVSDEMYRMVYRQEGDTLHIEYCKESITFPSFNFNTDNLQKNLMITVPSDWICEKLDIDTASAEVNVRDMRINKVDFDGASGICEFENCDVHELDMDTASGDVNFEGTLNILDCDAASADCNITVYNIPSRIDIDTASGDLDLTLPEDCGFTCKMDTMSGDFSSDFETSTKNGGYHHGDGSCKITISAMSGDVNIHKHAGHNNSHH